MLNGLHCIIWLLLRWVHVVATDETSSPEPKIKLGAYKGAIETGYKRTIGRG